MEEEKFECPECGKVFGSEELLEEHSRLEHDSVVPVSRDKPEPGEYISRLRPRKFSSFGYGLVIGILLASVAFAGFSYYLSLDPGVPVKVTVVTCENCSYEKFRTATDRTFNARYEEVNYQSERGQKLIQKYNLKYVPAFILDKKVSQAENFSRVEPVLVEFDDAYVLPDEGNKAAQRLSSGKHLQQ